MAMIAAVLMRDSLLLVRMSTQPTEYAPQGELGFRGLNQRQHDERPMNVLLPIAVTTVVSSLK